MVTVKVGVCVYINKTTRVFLKSEKPANKLVSKSSHSSVKFCDWFSNNNVLNMMSVNKWWISNMVEKIEYITRTWLVRYYDY